MSDRPSFKQLQDAINHFTNSNYPISIDSVFKACEKYTEKLNEQVDKALKDTLEVTVVDTEFAQEFSYDLPGVEKEDISVTIVDSKLILKVSKQKGKKVDITSEITIPKSLDSSKVLPKLYLGVLTLRIAKVETLKPRTIKID